MYAPGAYRNAQVKVFFSTNLTKAIHTALQLLSEWLLSNALPKEIHV